MNGYSFLLDMYKWMKYVRNVGNIVMLCWLAGVMHQIKRLAESELKVESPVKPAPLTASSSSLSSTSSGSLTSESLPTEKDQASSPAPEDSPSSSQM